MAARIAFTVEYECDTCGDKTVEDVKTTPSNHGSLQNMFDFMTEGIPAAWTRAKRMNGTVAAHWVILCPDCSD